MFSDLPFKVNTSNDELVISWPSWGYCTVIYQSAFSIKAVLNNIWSSFDLVGGRNSDWELNPCSFNDTVSWTVIWTLVVLTYRDVTVPSPQDNWVCRESQWYGASSRNNGSADWIPHEPNHCHFTRWLQGYGSGLLLALRVRVQIRVSVRVKVRAFYSVEDWVRDRAFVWNSVW